MKLAPCTLTFRRATMAVVTRTLPHDGSARR